MNASGLLDSPPDGAFDRYVQIARYLADVPIALVSLVDEHRQWFKAKVGLDATETPRSQAFCAHTIQEPHVMVVEDATRDARFADNPLVTGQLGIRFYAGAPIQVAGKHRLGTLCVIDTKPRSLAPEAAEVLASLAQVLAREIETNQLASVRAEREEVLQTVAIEANHHMRNLFAKVNAIVAMTAREAQTTEEAVRLTQQRLAALDESSELARKNLWHGQPITALIDAGVAPLRRAAPDRSGAAGPTREGPDLRLSDANASVLVPLVNELAHDGQSRGTPLSDAVVGWQVEDGLFRFTWREALRTQGRAAKLPDRMPFAGDYLMVFGPGALGGKAEVTVTTAGPSYTLYAPWERLRATD